MYKNVGNEWVTLNHPYIEEEDTNKVTNEIWRLQKVVGGHVYGIECMGHASMGWCAPELLCTTCLNANDSLSMCQRLIGFLAG